MERMVTLETPGLLDKLETGETLDPKDPMVTRVLLVTRGLLELMVSQVTRVLVGPLE